MSVRKSTARAKLKATCQEERLQKWKENFKNLLKNSYWNHKQTDQKTY